MDSWRHRNERSFADLVSELRAASLEFRRWWASPFVHSTGDGVKTFWSKDGKAVEYSYSVLTVSEKQSQRLVVFMRLKEAQRKNGVSYAAHQNGDDSA
jgi:MmyB-like transcription regulator ligand binding domain